MASTVPVGGPKILPEVQKNVQDIQVSIGPGSRARSEAARQRTAPAFTRPDCLRAGFAAHLNDLSDSGLLHVGEQWAPQQFMINAHSHPTWEFYLQMHGVTRWKADEQVWTVRPGDLLGVPPETLHCMAEESSANIHFMYAAFDPSRSWARAASLGEAWVGHESVIHLHSASRLIEPFAQLVNEVTTTQEFFETGLVLALDRITLELTRQLRPAHRGRALDMHPAVHETQTTLDRDFDRPWLLKDLADRVSLAPNYLAALFSAELGRGPHEYQTERRIARAKQLLTASDLSVTTIAMEVGFSSGQHLARTFRHVTGMTPSAYRKDGS